MPKISIIIPVYNAIEYLEKCLESILIQELEGIEVILVNDGSTDTTEEIIDKYIERYPSIFKKVNKKNGGQGSARNAGMNEANRRIHSFYRCR